MDSRDTRGGGGSMNSDAPRIRKTDSDGWIDPIPQHVFDEHPTWEKIIRWERRARSYELNEVFGPWRFHLAGIMEKKWNDFMEPERDGETYYLSISVEGYL